MQSMKYVLNRNNGKFVLFPAEIGMKHKDINGNWTNAGFVRLTIDYKGKGDIEVQCYGKSVSLNLCAGSEDADIISKSLNHE